MIQLQPVAPHIRRGRIAAEAWPAFAQVVKEEGGRLVALWGSDDHHLGAGYALHVTFITALGLVWISADLEAPAPAHLIEAGILPRRCCPRSLSPNFPMDCRSIGNRLSTPATGAFARLREEEFSEAVIRWLKSVTSGPRVRKSTLLSLRASRGTLSAGP